MKYWTFFLLISYPFLLSGQSKLALGENEFYFEFQDKRYAGFIDIPVGPVKGVLVLLPGSGKTDFLGDGGFGHFFRQKRDSLLSVGFAVCAWDKQGCGGSEGEYTEDLSIDDSAEEALAAISKLQTLQVPGISHIGLWSISRSGWVCPIIISKIPTIAFWISISGTSQYDNFRYLLETNFLLEGEAPSRVAVLLKEWDFHMDALHNDEVNYEAYIKGTQQLYQASFYRRLSPAVIDNSTFKEIQAELHGKPRSFDPETGLRILVPNFSTYLRKIKIPVLAILGEKDSQIDWKRTETLYQQTMGEESEADLKIIKLPYCNHLMMRCKTGAMFEDLQSFDYGLCPDYYPSMKNWLEQLRFKE